MRWEEETINWVLTRKVSEETERDMGTRRACVRENQSDRAAWREDIQREALIRLKKAFIRPKRAPIRPRSSGYQTENALSDQKRVPIRPRSSCYQTQSALTDQKSCSSAQRVSHQTQTGGLSDLKKALIRPKAPQSGPILPLTQFLRWFL